MHASLHTVDIVDVCMPPFTLSLSPPVVLASPTDTVRCVQSAEGELYKAMPESVAPIEPEPEPEVEVDVDAQVEELLAARGGAWSGSAAAGAGSGPVGYPYTSPQYSSRPSPAAAAAPVGYRCVSLSSPVPTVGVCLSPLSPPWPPLSASLSASLSPLSPPWPPPRRPPPPSPPPPPAPPPPPPPSPPPFPHKKDRAAARGHVTCAPTLCDASCCSDRRTHPRQHIRSPKGEPRELCSPPPTLPYSVISLSRRLSVFRLSVSSTLTRRTLVHHRCRTCVQARATAAAVIASADTAAVRTAARQAAVTRGSSRRWSGRCIRPWQRRPDEPGDHAQLRVGLTSLQPSSASPCVMLCVVPIRRMTVRTDFCARHHASAGTAGLVELRLRRQCMNTCMLGHRQSPRPSAMHHRTHTSPRT
jgi:hypothetical protein